MSLKALFDKILKGIVIPKKKITVATDCSGIEAPLIALDLMGVKYEHIFSSEIDKNCKEFIMRNFPPKTFYNDLKLRDNRKLVKLNLDLYIAGFPCQTFSSLGKNEGFDNELKGTVFFYVHDFIATVKPKIFILENVRTLQTHDKGNTFDTILNALYGLKDYDIHYRILNTKDFGIPQSRNRLFIVGIRKDIIAQKFVFPNPIGSIVNLRNILDNAPPESISDRHASLMLDITQKYKDIDFYGSADTWILNLNVSSLAWFRKGQPNISPCIVTSAKYYIPYLNRYLSPTEALKLQGIPWKKYNFDFAENAIYKFAGNTISINVITFLLSSIFRSVNI